MHIVSESEEKVVILIPKNIYDEDKSKIMKKIKSFLLMYNKIYHFLEFGFYQVEVGFNKLVGTILEIEKLDDLDFGSTTIDLRIVLLGNITIGLELDDLLFVKDYYLYQNKIYVSDKMLNRESFLLLCEHSRIVLASEMESVLTYGYKKSSLTLENNCDHVV